MEISQITGAGNFKMFTASRIALKFPTWGIWVSRHFHPRGPNGCGFSQMYGAVHFDSREAGARSFEGSGAHGAALPIFEITHAGYLGPF